MIDIKHQILPRVRVTYDVEIGDSIEKKELPFVMGVIGNFYGHKTDIQYTDRQFISINQDNFDDVMRGINPNIIIHLPDKTKISLNFSKISDFHPDSLVHNISPLKAILEQRQVILDFICLMDVYPQLSAQIKYVLNDRMYSAESISNPGSTNESSTTVTDETAINDIPTSAGADEISKSDHTTQSMAETIADRAGISREDIEQYKTRVDIIATIIDTIDLESQDPHLSSLNTISKLDQTITKTIDTIIHDPIFLQIEASWRGLYDLVVQSKLDHMLMIKILATSSKEIYQDLTSAMRLDYSHLFKLIHDNEYGVLGGIPFGCIIFDEYFSHNNWDTKLLKMLSDVSSASHAPILTGTSSNMFNLESFKDLANKSNISALFSSSEYVAWNHLREYEHARYINLFLPHVLMRTPYGDNNQIQSFNYQENLNHESTNGFCWGNPAYYMGIKINEAITKHGWAGSIRGTFGGMVQDLPTYTFKSSFGEIKFKSPLQTHINDRQEKQLSDNGFIALCHKKMTNHGIFLSGQSIQKAKIYHDPNASSNAIIASRITYMLTASRFAHYAHMIVRDKIGAFESGQSLEKYLQSWISQYVLLIDDSTQDLKCTYPLREAEVYARDIQDKPGEYEITIRMRPHFQLEGASVSIRFVSRSLSG